MAHAGVRLGHGGAGHCVDSVVQYGQSLRVDEFRLPALIWLDMAVKKTIDAGYCGTCSARHQCMCGKRRCGYRRSASGCVPYEDIHSNEMRAMTSYPR